MSGTADWQPVLTLVDDGGVENAAAGEAIDAVALAAAGLRTHEPASSGSDEAAGSPPVAKLWSLPARVLLLSRADLVAEAERLGLGDGTDGDELAIAMAVMVLRESPVHLGEVAEAVAAATAARAEAEAAAEAAAAGKKDKKKAKAKDKKGKKDKKDADAEADAAAQLAQQLAVAEPLRSLPVPMGAQGVTSVLLRGFPGTLAEARCLERRGVSIGSGSRALLPAASLPRSLWSADEMRAVAAAELGPDASDDDQGPAAADASAADDARGLWAGDGSVSDGVACPLATVITVLRKSGVPEAEEEPEAEPEPEAAAAGKGKKAAAGKKKGAAAAAEEAAVRAKEEAAAVASRAREAEAALRAANGGAIGAALFRREALRGTAPWAGMTFREVPCDAADGAARPRGEVVAAVLRDAEGAECLRRAFGRWMEGAGEIIDVPWAVSPRDVAAPPRFPAAAAAAARALRAAVAAAGDDGAASPRTDDGGSGGAASGEGKDEEDEEDKEGGDVEKDKEGGNGDEEEQHDGGEEGGAQRAADGTAGLTPPQQEAEASSLLGCYRSLMAGVPDACVGAVTVALALREAVATAAGEPLERGYDVVGDVLGAASDEAPRGPPSAGRITAGLGRLSLPDANDERRRRCAVALGAGAAGAGEHSAVLTASSLRSAEEAADAGDRLAAALDWAASGVADDAAELDDAAHSRVLVGAMAAGESVSTVRLGEAPLAALERALLQGMGPPAMAAAVVARAEPAGDSAAWGGGDGASPALSSALVPGHIRPEAMAPDEAPVPPAVRGARMTELGCFTGVPRTPLLRAWRLQAAGTLLGDWDRRSRETGLEEEVAEGVSARLSPQAVEAELRASGQWESWRQRWSKRLSASAAAQALLLARREGAGVRAAYDPRTDSCAMVLYRPTPRRRRRLVVSVVGERGARGMLPTLPEWEDSPAWREQSARWLAPAGGAGGADGAGAGTPDDGAVAAAAGGDGDDAGSGTAAEAGTAAAPGAATPPPPPPPPAQVLLRSRTPLASLAASGTREVRMFPGDGALVTLRRRVGPGAGPAGEGPPWLTVLRRGAAFGLQPAPDAAALLAAAAAGGFEVPGMVAAGASAAPPLADAASDTALCTAAGPSPTGPCVFTGSLAAHGEGPGSGASSESSVQVALRAPRAGGGAAARASGRRRRKAPPSSRVWAEVTVTSGGAAVSVGTDGSVRQRGAAGAGAGGGDGDGGSLMALVEAAARRHRKVAALASLSSAVGKEAVGQWPPWLPESERRHTGSLGTTVRSLLGGAVCAMTGAGAEAWWVPGPMRDWAGDASASSVEEAEARAAEERAAAGTGAGPAPLPAEAAALGTGRLGQGTFVCVAPNGARSVIRVGEDGARRPAVRIPALPVRAAVDPETGALVAVRHGPCPVPDPVAVAVARRKDEAARIRMARPMPKYRSAREALRLRLLQQRLREEHAAERREILGGPWSGVEVDDEGAPASALGVAGVAGSVLGGQESKEALEEGIAAAGAGAGDWALGWADGAGALGRSVVVQFPDGRVMTRHADGTCVVSEPDALPPVQQEALARLFEAAAAGSPPPEGARAVGLDTASGASDLPRRVVVASPGLATVELDSRYHEAAEHHARGLPVRLASSGMRTRLTVLTPDNSVLAADYDVSVTARVPARVRLLCRDGTRLVALSTGKVTLRPSDAAGTPEEDADAMAAADARGIASAAATAPAGTAGAETLEGRAAAEAVTSRETAAGVYSFALGTGEFETTDSERSVFAVGPAGQTVVDVGGSVSVAAPGEVPARRLIFPPLRRPASPRVLLLPERGAGGGGGAELLLHEGEWRELLASADGSARLLEELGPGPGEEGTLARQGTAASLAGALTALTSPGGFGAEDLVGFGAAEGSSGMVEAGRLEVVAAAVMGGEAGEAEADAERAVAGRGAQRGGGGRPGDGHGRAVSHALVSYVKTGSQGAGPDRCGWAGIRGHQVLACDAGWMRPPSFSRHRPTRSDVFGDGAKPTPGELRRQRRTQRERGQLDATLGVVFAADDEDIDSPRAGGGKAPSPRAGTSSPRPAAGAAGRPGDPDSRVVAELPALALGPVPRAPRARIAAVWSAVVERDELDGEALEALRVDEEACEAWRGSVAATVDRFVVRDGRSAEDVGASDGVARLIMAARMPGAPKPTGRSRPPSRPKSRVAVSRAVKAAGGPLLASESKTQLAMALDAAHRAEILDPVAALAARRKAELEAKVARQAALRARTERWQALRHPGALAPQRGTDLAPRGEPEQGDTGPRDDPDDAAFPAAASAAAAGMLASSPGGRSPVAHTRSWHLSDAPGREDQSATRERIERKLWASGHAQPQRQ